MRTRFFFGDFVLFVLFFSHVSRTGEHAAHFTGTK